MNEIKRFNHSEFGELRAIEIDGEPWFIGKEVAEKLGYKNTRDALLNHVDKEDKNTVAIHDGIGNPNKVIINESGVYSLVIGSKLESAKRFKRWVTSEVLPSLRKYGKYSMVKKPDSYMIEDEIERAKRWIEEAEERRQLALTVKEQEETIEKQQPLVNFAKTVSNSEDCIDMNSMAKLIYKETGIRIGRNKLFEILRENKILMFNNQPYQRYIADGTFKLNEKPYKDCEGETRLSIKTLVTGKGQIKLCKFIQKKYYNE